MLYLHSFIFIILYTVSCLTPTTPVEAYQDKARGIDLLALTQDKTLHQRRFGDKLTENSLSVDVCMHTRNNCIHTCFSGLFIWLSSLLPQ